ncbi:class II fructose-bisphosphate aldolase [Propionispira raffinosivorans]|uniref:class II fructose-bisphosphate aldolase n=1 Tax=Propionispira raffinosivorans TaxID=86959 RepID=UPI0003798E6A|nr:class II fructose-bisphosphate aldolase [Propionispira raffinosivorans]
MLVTSKELLQTAKQQKFAIPSANFFDWTSVMAHTEVASEMKLPIILSYAEAHKDYLSLEEAALLGKFYGKKVDVPVVLHLDHGTSLAVVKQAIDLGFTSVMIDASQDVLEKNIVITKEVVAYAHAKGVVVEAEIGHVGTGTLVGSVGEGGDSGQDDDSIYTSAEEAMEMCKQTKVDSLAISIGTAHGTYKGIPVINFTRLEEIAASMDTPLVLHGGSSSGDTNLNRCATSGIAKINIYTDFVLAAKDKMSITTAENYYEVIAQAKQGIKDCLKHYYQVFETAKYNK